MSTSLTRLNKPFASLGPEAGLVDVAHAAGLSRSAVYATFNDRCAVIDALATRHTSKILAEMQEIVRGLPDPREQTRACIDILARWFDEEPNLAQALSQHIGNRPSLASGLAAILAAGFASRGLEPSPAEPWAYGLIGAVSTTVHWWALTRSIPRSELVEHLTSLIWGGFAGASDR